MGKFFRFSETKECTFTPNVNSKRAKSKSKSTAGNHEDLYLQLYNVSLIFLILGKQNKTRKFKENVN